MQRAAVGENVEPEALGRLGRSRAADVTGPQVAPGEGAVAGEPQVLLEPPSPALVGGEAPAPPGRATEGEDGLGVRADDLRCTRVAAPHLVGQLPRGAGQLLGVRHLQLGAVLLHTVRTGLRSRQDEGGQPGRERGHVRLQRSHLSPEDPCLPDQPRHGDQGDSPEHTSAGPLATAPTTSARPVLVRVQHLLLAGPGRVLQQAPHVQRGAAAVLATDPVHVIPLVHRRPSHSCSAAPGAASPSRIRAIAWWDRLLTVPTAIPITSAAWASVRSSK